MSSTVVQEGERDWNRSVPVRLRTGGGGPPCAFRFATGTKCLAGLEVDGLSCKLEPALWNSEAQFRGHHTYSRPLKNSQKTNSVNSANCLSPISKVIRIEPNKNATNQLINYLYCQIYHLKHLFLLQ